MNVQFRERLIDMAQIIGGEADELVVQLREARERIAELETSLRSIVADIEDYERVNNLSPSPGKPDCWQSVTHAKAVLAKS